MPPAAQESFAVESRVMHPRRRLIEALPVKERQLRLNGVLTSVLEGGEGPPVVLLHGPGAYAAQWIRTIPALVATHRVIAPDLPGHGASEFFGDGLTTARVAGWLDDLIECTCTRAPVLVGHTLGGAVAARFAAESGRSLDRLVLVDTLGLTQFQPAAAFGAALHAYLQSAAADTHDALWSQCVFDLDGVKRQLGEYWPWIRAANLDGSRPQDMAALNDWMVLFGLPAIPAATLADIKIPTALIWGRHDRATPLAVAEAASRQFAWPLAVIEGAADDPTLEQPEAFIAALAAAGVRP